MHTCRDLQVMNSPPEVWHHHYSSRPALSPACPAHFARPAHSGKLAPLHRPSQSTLHWNNVTPAYVLCTKLGIRPILVAQAFLTHEHPATPVYLNYFRIG